jgi:trehalose 6-phosphate phosphatase
MAVQIAAELIEPFHRNPDRAAIITDFDGTLAPIVEDPADSQAIAGAPDLLTRLSLTYGRVAVVSGRPVSFLHDRLGLGPEIELRGLYGLESSRPGAVDDKVEAWRDAVNAVAARADAEAPAGVGVERKGLSVTLHYRTAPEQAPWVAQWTADQATTTGLARHPARMSWELVPPVPIHKGTTVLSLAAGFDAVCFIGDDVGDLPAFDALDQMAGQGAYALKVVVESPEVPPDLLKEADLIVPGPPGVMELLTLLAEVPPAR